MIVALLKRVFNRGEASCAETRELASDYLEKDLSPRKRSAIQAHLDRCGPCRAFMDALAATIEALSRFPQVTPPPSLKQSIIERTRQEGRQQSGS